MIYILSCRSCNSYCGEDVMSGAPEALRSARMFQRSDLGAASAAPLSFSGGFLECVSGDVPESLNKLINIKIYNYININIYEYK